MEEDTTVRDELKKMNENMKQLIDTGKPLKLKKLGKMAKKKGFVQYLYIHENGEIEATKVPISEGTTAYEDAPRLATPDYLLSYKGTPTIIQPAWSSKPFSKVENFEETVKEKMLSAGWRLLALRAEAGDVKTKKKMGMGVIIGILLALVVVGYLIFA